MQPASRHRIVRSDQSEDQLTRLRFDSYNAAYDELERYYGDFCCSDDDRVEYTIVSEPQTVMRFKPLRTPQHQPASFIAGEQSQKPDHRDASLDTNLSKH